jgi:hypothetical protein
MELHIDARRIARWLITLVVLLLLAHVAGTVSRYLLHHEQVYGLVDTFNLNFENNVPTFFSTLMLVASALLLAAVAGASDDAREARYWKGLALVFAFLAIDEDASLHELLIDPLRFAFSLGGPLRFAWVVPYGVAVAALAVPYLRFVMSQPPRSRRLLMAAAAVYLAGALGFECLGAWYLSYHDDTEDFAYSLLVGAEESLEMTGAAVLIYALLDALGHRLAGRPVRLYVRRSNQASRSRNRWRDAGAVNSA